jgi:hypothetical protein
MGMIGPEEVGELDERLLKLFQTLVHTKDACAADAEAARRFLEWVIYPDWERDKELEVRAIEWSEGLNEFERPMLTEIARAACDLVRSGKNRDKPPLVERCRLMLRLRCVPFGDVELAEPAPKVDRRTDARDKFAYEKICKGAPPKQVLAAIDQHPDWDLPKTVDELYDFAVLYSRRHSLPLPPAR